MQGADIRGDEAAALPFVGRMTLGPGRKVAGAWEDMVVLGAARALVTLPSSTPRRIQVRVQSELDSPDACTESVVQAIPLIGVDAVASFSVVFAEAGMHGESPRVTIVVRGGAVVDVHSVGGSARVSAQGLVPWHLVTFNAVGAVVVGAASGRQGIWQLDSEYSLALGPGTDTAGTSFDPSAFEETRLVAPPSKMPCPSAGSSRDEAPGAESKETRPASRFEIRSSGGSPIEILGPIVIGRDPRPRRIPGSRAPMILRVESRSSMVSASHAEIALVGENVVVTDLASTNGTTVTLPDGSRIKLRQGDSLVTPDLSRIDVGDGNVFEVLKKSV